MRILIIPDPCGRPYLVRYTLASFFGRELKLHVMLRSDNDRELHDHPWGFWSLVLAGGYDELCVAGPNIVPAECPPKLAALRRNRCRIILRDPGDFAYRGPLWRHRVLLRYASTNQKTPWPVRVLQWLERFPRVTATPLWWQAMEAIEDQANRDERTCVTLVVTTRRKRVWGFWRNGEFIPHTIFKADVEC